MSKFVIKINKNVDNKLSLQLNDKVLSLKEDADKIKVEDILQVVNFMSHFKDVDCIVDFTNMDLD